MATIIPDLNTAGLKNSIYGFIYMFAQQPISFFFVACICFYFLCIVLRINPWVSIFGALAYAYSTYDPVIIMVGHVTKMAAMGYAPAVLASFLMILQKQWWRVVC